MAEERNGGIYPANLTRELMEQHCLVPVIALL